MERLGDLISRAIGPDELAAFLTADSGCRLGVYWLPSGELYASVGDSVGAEIDPEEGPICSAACPGLGNADMTWWRNGWDCAGMTDSQVIEECCRDGDVSDELLALHRLLIEQTNNCWGQDLGVVLTEDSLVSPTNGGIMVMPAQPAGGVK